MTGSGWIRREEFLEPVTNLGLSPELAKCDFLIRKSAFDLGGLGLSRVLSATSRRHFSSEE